MAESPAALRRSPADPLDEVERMRQDVVDLRVGIGRDARELRRRVRAAFDLRRQISRHPLVAAAVAVAGALVIARVVGSLLRAVWPRRRGSPGRPPCHGP